MLSATTSSLFPDTHSSFLNDIERIASSDYEPSDDDVVRARLRTVGIQEHKFVVEGGRLIVPTTHDVPHDSVSHHLRKRMDNV